METVTATQQSYRESVEAFRAARAESLLADGSFLTLAGLFWLEQGENPFGAEAGPENTILLPGGSAPARAGVFRLDGDVVTVTLAPGVEAFDKDGAPVQTMQMKPDSSGTPDYLLLNQLAMLILQRGDRYAVRLFDNDHPARATFPGLRWYPIAPAFRLDARFVAYDPPKQLTIVDAVGTVGQQPSPGYVEFEWNGDTYRLDALDRGEKLFYIFADATNRTETYGAGRFLYSAKPQAGQLELDFNQATNPYCAYTPYATCPTPPKENRLPFAVQAGELNYHPPA